MNRSHKQREKPRQFEASAAPVCQQRRNLLRALPSLLFFATASSAYAQQATPVAVRKLHAFTIRVRDVGRSLQFYQDLFAAPVQARQGDSILLRIGSGPHHFRLRPLRAGESPGFDSIGLSVENFDAVRVQQQLMAFGVMPGSPPAAQEPPLSRAMQSWIVERGPGEGGASSGTRELYFEDIEGIRYHLTATDYCGGSGPLGSLCPAPEPSPSGGLFRLVDLSHFTTFLANRDRANSFYTRAFGKTYQAYQGPGSPVIGVGDGIQFLMYVGGTETGEPDGPGRIDHCCFSVTDFNVDRILGQLTDYGLRARQEPDATGPLMHWISMRMPNRGGAPGGTPELYFTDPDGIRIQLQDPGYCGGTGYLGDQCPPLESQAN